MAQIVYIDNANQNGARVLAAIAQLRTALGTFQELDGLRLESISAGAGVMMKNFGAVSEQDAQALSDRWGALLAAYEDWQNAEYAKLRDIVNATTSSP